MENKLQELTQKLYDEGLSKGREEAEKREADAKGQEKKSVSDAEQEEKSSRGRLETAPSARDREKEGMQAEA